MKGWKRSRRKTLPRLGDRFQVHAFIPPQRIAEIADQRVEGLVGFFLAAARKDMNWVNDLYTLARSCYMQGIHDMEEATRKLAVGEIHVDPIESDR